MGNESTKLAGESENNEERIKELIEHVKKFGKESIPKIIDELEKLKKSSKTTDNPESKKPPSTGQQPPSTGQQPQPSTGQQPQLLTGQQPQLLTGQQPQLLTGQQPQQFTGKGGRRTRRHHKNKLNRLTG